MGRFHWSIKAVVGATAADFAAKLESELNGLEDQGFEVDNFLSNPGGGARGLIVVGKKPRQPARFPAG